MKYNGALSGNFRYDIYDRIIVLGKDRTVIDKKIIGDDGSWEIESEVEIAEIIYLLKSKYIGALMADISSQQEISATNFFPVSFNFNNIAPGNNVLYINPIHLEGIPDEFINLLNIDIKGPVTLHVWELLFKQNPEIFNMQEGQYRISVPALYNIHEKGIKTNSPLIKTFNGIKNINSGKFYTAVNQEVLLDIDDSAMLELEFI
jgi:hypothetical protein